MCIGACAYMEQKWLHTLSTQTRALFRSVRFMDDILLIHLKNQQPPIDECYTPLVLEDGDKDTFLETKFARTNNNLTFRLKNKNEIPGTIWRYQHYNSYGNHKQRIATMHSALRKVNKMASDDEQLKISALTKLKEFKSLQ